MDLPPSSSINIAGAYRSTAADSNITGRRSASEGPTASDSGASRDATETDQDDELLVFYEDLDPREFLARCNRMVEVWDHLGGTTGEDRFEDEDIAKAWEDACDIPFGDALAVFEEALMILVGNPD